METLAKTSPLTESEWKELRSQINELFDITFRYAEMVAKEGDSTWDRDRPKFYKPTSKNIDEAIAEYEARLAAFEAERKRSYLENYTKLKADSVDRVAVIERLFERLAQVHGFDISKNHE